MEMSGEACENSNRYTSILRDSDDDTDEDNDDESQGENEGNGSESSSSSGEEEEVPQMGGASSNVVFSPFYIQIRSFFSLPFNLSFFPLSFFLKLLSFLLVFSNSSHDSSPQQNV